MYKTFMGGVLSVLFVASVYADDPGFQFYDLGDLGNPEEATPHAINDAGVIVGISAGVEFPEVSRAFRWSNGVIEDLSMAMKDGEVVYVHHAIDISESGDIVGWAEGGVPYFSGVFLLTGDELYLLDVPECCDKYSGGADAIDGNGTMIVGDCWPIDQIQSYNVVVFWPENGSSAIIEAPPELPIGTDGSAYGVNDHGAVVGSFSGDTSPTKSYVWQDGDLTLLENTLNSDSMVAYDINNAGTIVGVAGGFAFKIEDGMMTSMGLGTAFAVNDRGQAVGRDLIPDPVPMLYSNGQAIDLSYALPHDWEFNRAYDINNYGWVVGWAQFGTDDAEDAWLLVPIYEKGDYDGDGDVDFQDFGKFQECFAAEPFQGPEGGLHVGCSVFDFDDDVDLDLTDYAAFQKAFTGPTAPDLNPYGPG